MSCPAQFAVRSLVVGSMLMTLACGAGGEAPPVTPAPDAGPPAPPDGKVPHFLPVTAISTHPDSLVRAVSKPKSATGIVILRDDKPGMNGEVLFRPEMWFDLDDGTMVHMTTDGTGPEPSVTTFERMGESIRLEQVERRHPRRPHRRQRQADHVHGRQCSEDAAADAAVARGACWTRR